uniref:Uncharacterized protein n=1 Tax=Geladintestivirus 2 TaxID=3233134 RepID=A0AAU8MM79_9CAUD
MRIKPEQYEEGITVLELKQLLKGIPDEDLEDSMVCLNADTNLETNNNGVYYAKEIIFYIGDDLTIYNY